ncbi:hypothetical protein GCM10023310_08200 [Paenibacillus vulneris]|uniref:Uncharacterized protein n=1 Tax=Paenibacillus vulneris TaxID=1133364 RepID=A0ABW3UQB2_9BACL
MKRINLVIDTGDNMVEVIPAYLVSTAGTHALFLYEGTVNYVMVAPTQKKDVYVEHFASIKLGTTDRGEIALIELDEKLRAMSAYELLNYHVIHECEEIPIVRD